MSISDVENAMKPNPRYSSCSLAVMLALSGIAPIAAAAVTDLANGPLANGAISNMTVKPNIAFVVDDSGSMDDENMPNDGGTNDDKRCYGWYKYNTLFYNPNVTYKPPFKIDGALYSDGMHRFPDASFTAALRDGYFPQNGYTYGGGSTSNTTVNLTTAPSPPSPPSSSDRYYYTYPASSSNNNSTSCLSESSYSKVTSASNIQAPGVTTGSAAAKTNYANWYSYYRKRAYLMKAATGEAFKDMDESQFRVGLFFLNSNESGAGSRTSGADNSDLKIADFSGSASGTQRYDWYTKLYRGRSGGWTPNRGALSRMGRMYAGKISEWDPVQYSCQQNFTILSTDGYWNTPGETSTYGPKDIDGANVGNTDGGGAAAIGATANISIGAQSGSGSNSCYKFTALTVDAGAGAIQLMDPTKSAPNNCTTDRDALGQALRDAINTRTATTGFGATYNNGTVTMTSSPTLYPGLNAMPQVTVVKSSGTKSRTFTPTAFGGFTGATTGASVPYKDAFNVANTLGDLAYYYYNTDLRNQARNNCTNGTYTNLCENNVRGSGKDTNNQQHMTTFTIGLGVSGAIKYESNYDTAPDIAGVTQYYDIKNGTANWPNPDDDLAKIDDLWHAAVNGRGTYYSATDSTTLKDGIQSALAGISARRGSSAAAATSNLEPVAGDNYVYVALYQTVRWDGDLKAFAIDPDTGALSGNALWSAQEKLDAQVTTAEAAATPSDGRTIKYFSANVTGKLKDFTSANLSADGLSSHFSDICNKTPAVEQCSTSANPVLSSTQVTAANDPANLVNYLRGRSQHEDEASNATMANRLYRGRDHLLGDIVNAVPVYMKKPPFAFDKYDATYGDFKTNNSTRASTVFIAANDGMLHAINADNNDNNKGRERWAFVPTLVMPNMYNLADRNYDDNHRFFVDGSPTLADVCTTLSSSNAQLCAAATNWKTILIGGLNKGGCGYYALDVTDPTNPKGLWEFTHANLGYSFGNPVVAKRKDGKWVVIFTSGFNNYPNNGCGTTGDGNGHVFVVDAVTGALLEDIPTNIGGSPAGIAATPSGLGKLNSWITDPAMPVADRLYAGDMLGNLWRIDFDDNYGPNGKEAMLLAQLKDGNNNPQPITTKPELAELAIGTSRYAVVMASTGRYLGNNDVADVSQQSIYGIKDSLTSTGVANVRGSTMVARTLSETVGSAGGALAGRTIRTVSGSTLNWASQDGWYLDLNPSNRSPGERVNVDMSLQFNTLTVAANVPSTNSCDAGGYAFLYFLDINNGKNMATAVDGMAGVRLSGNALVAGIRTVRVASGTKTIVTDTTGNVSSEDGGGDDSLVGVVRRTMWREIPD
jgi:type IV pilus assembly protein PilY1